MPVIINDFEIVVEPPEAPETTGGREDQPPGGGQPIRPDEIVQVMQLHDERMTRLRAD
jgi:hypothetical protein